MSSTVQAQQSTTSLASSLHPVVLIPQNATQQQTELTEEEQKHAMHLRGGCIDFSSVSIFTPAAGV